MRIALAAAGALTASALLAGCATTPAARSATGKPAPSEGGLVIRDKPATLKNETELERVKPFQFLYGSGEAGALSIQAFHALIGYAQAQIAKRPTDSVVLAADATLAAPAFAPCGDKPFAAVFDVDETVVANLGFEQRAALGEKYDFKIWESWEKTGADKIAPIPGAVTAMNALRKMGVTVIFNTNRMAANAQGTIDAIGKAGLGSAVHGETLFLKGDDTLGSKKDGRRATIAAKYCVIAMGGDQLGDFSDQFNIIDATMARREAAISGKVTGLWGNGWFVLPNPVYGSGLKGDVDEIFPMDKRWGDPAEESK